MRPLLFITFPQGFRISKNIGHLTSGSGDKKRLNGTSKVNTRTQEQTDRRTNRLIESSGPEGQCFVFLKHNLTLVGFNFYQAKNYEKDSGVCVSCGGNMPEAQI